MKPQETETDMKIAVSSQGDGLDAAVDPRFGRAAAFVVYDTDTSETVTIQNDLAGDASHGAGISAAETVCRHGASCVLTGRCGPKACDALVAAGVSVYTGASGTIADAVQAFEQGALQCFAAPENRTIET